MPSAAGAAISRSTWCCSPRARRIGTRLIFGKWGAFPSMQTAERGVREGGGERVSEERDEEVMGVKRWAKATGLRGRLERFAMRPTVNIQGLNAGYTGPGGKTVMPHRALAKLEVRLVPDMK